MWFIVCYIQVVDIKLFYCAGNEIQSRESSTGMCPMLRNSRPANTAMLTGAWRKADSLDQTSLRMKQCSECYLLCA